MCGNLKNKINEETQQDRLIDTENKQLVAKGKLGLSDKEIVERD